MRQVLVPRIARFYNSILQPLRTKKAFRYSDAQSGIAFTLSQAKFPSLLVGRQLGFGGLELLFAEWFWYANPALWAGPDISIYAMKYDPWCNEPDSKLEAESELLMADRLYRPRLHYKGSWAYSGSRVSHCQLVSILLLRLWRRRFAIPGSQLLLYPSVESLLAMVLPDKPASNGFVATSRKTYRALGFQRGYNFILFFVFGGVALGFSLARFYFNDFYGVYCSLENPRASPGECYYYLNFSVPHVAIRIHLATCLPSFFLAVFQFVPAIRYKAMLYHRVAGWVIVLLILVTNCAAIAIAPYAYGGTVSTQMGVGLVAILTTFALVNAAVNIKLLQIDQHRAWMLRAWFYLGFIVTLRIIMACSATILSSWHTPKYQSMPCEKIAWMIDNQADTAERFPSCVDLVTNATIGGMHASVRGNSLDPNGIEEVSAVQGMSFDMALWLAIVLHAIGVELYLRLTPKEAERLRQVSYSKQLARGMSNPGSAGFVPEKIGDMDPWVPKKQRRSPSVDRTDSQSGLNSAQRD